MTLQPIIKTNIRTYILYKFSFFIVKGCRIVATCRCLTYEIYDFFFCERIQIYIRRHVAYFSGKTEQMDWQSQKDPQIDCR